MTAEELIAWINEWRVPRDGWAYPNRMLYALTDLLCDFELADLSPDVLTALASPIPEAPPPAGAWEYLRLRGRDATAAVLDGLANDTITPMQDMDNIRTMMNGLIRRDVQ